MLVIDWQVLIQPTKKQILTVGLQNCKNSAVKLLENSTLIYLLNLFSIFCRRLQLEQVSILPYSIGTKCRLHTKQIQRTYFESGSTREKGSVKLTIDYAVRSVNKIRGCRPEEMPNLFSTFFLMFLGLL